MIEELVGKHVMRARDGRFSQEEGRWPDHMLPLAAAAFCGALALIVLRSGGDMSEVWRQLARKGENSRDPKWMEAVRARAIALYLVNQLSDVPQTVLARALGLETATICTALKRVEDWREDPGADAAIRAVARMLSGKELP